MEKQKQQRSDNFGLRGIVVEISRESETKDEQAVQTLVKHLETLGAVRTASALFTELDEACEGRLFKKLMEGAHSSKYDVVLGEDLDPCEHCVVDLDAMRAIFGEDLRLFLVNQVKEHGLARLRESRSAVVIHEEELLEALSRARIAHDPPIPDMVLVACIKQLVEQDNPGSKVEHSPEDGELILGYDMLSLALEE